MVAKFAFRWGPGDAVMKWSRRKVIWLRSRKQTVTFNGDEIWVCNLFLIRSEMPRHQDCMFPMENQNWPIIHGTSSPNPIAPKWPYCTRKLFHIRTTETNHYRVCGGPPTLLRVYAPSERTSRLDPNKEGDHPWMLPKDSTQPCGKRIEFAKLAVAATAARGKK